MRRNGFRVVQKPVKLERDGTRRARLEVEITTDMMNYADKVDLIILVSGDEDFAYPLQTLAQNGVRVEVAGFRSAMANKVMDVADRYIELDLLADRFRKEAGRRRRRGRLPGKALGCARCSSRPWPWRSAGQTPGARMRRDVAFLASPALEGRGDGSEGLEKAAAYVAKSYRRIGLRVEVQRFPFVSRVERVEGAASLSGRPLAFGRDLEAAGCSADADLEALPLRFVGCGLKAGDYDDLGEVAGQAAVVFRRLPETRAFAHSGALERGLFLRIARLQAAGAAAVIVAEEGDAPHALVLEEGPSRLPIPVVSMPARTLALPGPAAPTVSTSRTRAGPSAPPVPGAALDLRLRLRRVESQLPNLIAVLRGSDPRRRGEYIALGAHLDHLGLGERHSLGARRPAAPSIPGPTTTLRARPWSWTWPGASPAGLRPGAWSSCTSPARRRGS